MTNQIEKLSKINSSAGLSIRCHRLYLFLAIYLNVMIIEIVVYRAFQTAAACGQAESLAKEYNDPGLQVVTAAHLHHLYQKPSFLVSHSGRSLRDSELPER